MTLEENVEIENIGLNLKLQQEMDKLPPQCKNVNVRTYLHSVL
ncbi:hypothetical protein SAMN05421636_1233 [Pricia antarctica]|uniref:Uncharacterized protein n=1 Tax=Pricia antarctica TaxID=641691 RepID=A0A1G7JEC1_9FLAO|nr:hypothetical protein SAMN05421636_1233 [Pricia antarctica]